MNNSGIADLLARQPQGHSLLPDFYRQDEIFEAEVQALFMKSWLYVGHSSRLQQIGDYFLENVIGESIIVIRAAEDKFTALLNVCRHRGSRVCLESEGHVTRLVCPYHAWSYALDGQLLRAPSTEEDFKHSQYSLKSLQTVNFQGMLFVNFDSHASFSPIANDLDECLRPYQLDKTKVALRRSYPISSNWKLALENYSECYHCVPAHREFSVAHSRAYSLDKIDELTQPVYDRAKSLGLCAKTVNASWLNSNGIGIDRNFDRYALMKGHVTGSKDGQPVAPLLGTITGYDGGATDIQIGPLCYALAYCDHVVVYRFNPLGSGNTDCELTWLVHADAREGEDYDVDKLSWLWDVTTVADKRIIENNNRGVSSRFFEPGPYTSMEYWTQEFVNWYLTVLGSHDVQS